MFAMKVHSFISYIDCNMETRGDGCVINVICYYHQYLVMIILEVNLEYSPEEGWGLSKAQKGRIRGKYKRKRKETKAFRRGPQTLVRERFKRERGVHGPSHRKMHQDGGRICSLDLHPGALDILGGAVVAAQGPRIGLEDWVV